MTWPGIDAANRATRGKGLNRTGNSIKMSKAQIKQMMQLANLMENQNYLKSGFVSKMNNDIKKQHGGFIGTLLAGLAGSLLPSLLGKGLKRSGQGLRRAGKSD